MSAPTPCTLCGHSDPSFFYEDDTRIYLRCPECRLIFVPDRFHLTPDEEKARYDLHENDPYDPAYRAFLGRLFFPLNKLLTPGRKGLDFGSGPGPTLHLMFEEEGHHMRFYDPFFADDPTVFEETYDFITATEVLEHLFQPGKELDGLWDCLRPGGYMGIMTKLAKVREAFADWHYKRDETHVAFFSEETFEWLAGKWSADWVYREKDVTIFQKRSV